MRVYVTSDGSVFGVSQVANAYYVNLPRWSTHGLSHVGTRYSSHADAVKYLEKCYSGEWIDLSFETEEATDVREVTL